MGLGRDRAQIVAGEADERVCVDWLGGSRVSRTVKIIIIITKRIFAFRRCRRGRARVCVRWLVAFLSTRRQQHQHVMSHLHSLSVSWAALAARIRVSISLYGIGIGESILESRSQQRLPNCECNRIARTMTAAASGV